MNPDAEVDDDFPNVDTSPIIYPDASRDPNQRSDDKGIRGGPISRDASSVISDVGDTIAKTITDIKNATDAIKTATGGNKAVPPVVNNNALSTSQMIMIALGVIVLAYGAKKLLA